MEIECVREKLDKAVLRDIGSEECLQLRLLLARLFEQYMVQKGKVLL